MANIRGIAYPLTLSNGSLALAEDAELIRGHILSVLETEPFERVLQPRYGTPNLLFNATPDIYVVAQYCRQALDREISGVGFNVTGELGEDGAAIITINWSLNAIPQAPLTFELSS